MPHPRDPVLTSEHPEYLRLRRRIFDLVALTDNNRGPFVRWAARAAPAALPFILVGVRQAIGQSLVVAVVVGIITGNEGIGYYILFHQQAFNIPGLLAGVVAIAAVGYGLNALFLVLEKRLIRWRATDTAGQ